MSVAWSIEPARGLDGNWLVGRDKHTTWVIAPSGVPLVETDRPTECRGWRIGLWSREPDLCLDETPPASIQIIRPVDVISMTNAIGRLWVLNVLEIELAWLEVACSLDGVHRPGFEDRAHKQLRAVAWHRSELMVAFPDIYEACWADPERLVASPAPDPDAPAQLCAVVPDFYDEVLAQIVALPADSPEPQGARELWYLLRRRLMWKLVEKMSRLQLVVLYQLVPSCRAFGSLVERRLREQAVRGRWAPIAEHRDVVRAHEHVKIAGGHF